MTVIRAALRRHRLEIFGMFPSGGRPGAGCRGESDRAHTKADRSIRLDAHQRRDSVAQPTMSQIVPAALVPIEREFRLGQR